MKCYQIGHEYQSNSRDRSEKYIMYPDLYVIIEYWYRVDKCKLGKGKLYIHIIA